MCMQVCVQGCSMVTHRILPNFWTPNLLAILKSKMSNASRPHWIHLEPTSRPTVAAEGFLVGDLLHMTLMFSISTHRFDPSYKMAFKNFMKKDRVIRQVGIGLAYSKVITNT